MDPFMSGILFCLACMYLFWWVVTRMVVTTGAVIIFLEEIHNVRRKNLLLFLLWLAMMLPLIGEVGLLVILGLILSDRMK